MSRTVISITSGAAVVLSTAVVVWAAQECADELSVGNVAFFTIAGIAWAVILMLVAATVAECRRG